MRVARGLGGQVRRCESRHAGETGARGEDEITVLGRARRARPGDPPAGGPPLRIGGDHLDARSYLSRGNSLPAMTACDYSPWKPHRCAAAARGASHGSLPGHSALESPPEWGRLPGFQVGYTRRGPPQVDSRRQRGHGGPRFVERPHPQRPQALAPPRGDRGERGRHCIRDSGSAGSASRSTEEDGTVAPCGEDVIKLGDVVVTVLPATEAGTVVMQDEFGQARPARPEGSRRRGDDAGPAGIRAGSRRRPPSAHRLLPLRGRDPLRCGGRGPGTFRGAAGGVR